MFGRIGKFGLAITMTAFTLMGCDNSTVEEKGASTNTRTIGSGFHIDVDYRKLDNGLKVVLAPDDSVPTATVAVYYNIGFRNEPRDRTGFAHLFEHMMFEGSENLPEGAFDDLVIGNGGTLNGSTRFDFTNYFEVVPSHQLQRVLWAEADRMAGLNITETNLAQQQGVVKNEVKVNVLNRPYGGFPWLDMPQYANENWHNSHNFYGELSDLDAATLEDVNAFFETFYAPNNAVVVVAGDFNTEETFTWIESYFGPLEARDQPAQPDLTEPKQVQEKKAVKEDPLAPRPALAFAYHVPERNSEEWYAFGLIDILALQGSDSLLYQRLVKEKGYSSGIFGGINMLGNMFNYSGPMLWIGALIHDPSVEGSIIIEDVESTLQRLRDDPVNAQDLERARTKIRSTLYDLAGSSTRFGLVDLLASFALFDDNPGRINEIEAGFAEITPEIIHKTAQAYLVPENRTVLVVQPKQQGE